MNESYIYKSAKSFNLLLWGDLKLQGLTKSDLRLSDQGNWTFFSNAISQEVLKIGLFLSILESSILIFYCTRKGPMVLGAFIWDSSHSHWPPLIYLWILLISLSKLDPLL